MREITARRVLTHTTGWPNLRALAGGKLRFAFPPGERSNYSGEAFHLLKDSSGAARQVALWALCHIGDERACRPILRLLYARDPWKTAASRQAPRPELLSLTCLAFTNERPRRWHAPTGVTTGVFPTPRAATPGLIALAKRTTGSSSGEVR